MNKSKKYQADLNAAPTEPQPLSEAVARLKQFSPRNFDQSVECCLHLGIDPKQADQTIRGSVSLPHGIGQSRRVVAFCSEDKVDAARDAGAVDAGGEDLVEKVENGWMEFDVAIAEPAMMRVVSRLGRVLGPKGLMPSPKTGTVTQEVAQAVSEFAAGKVEYRNDTGGNVAGVIGKISFNQNQLVDNADAFIDHITKLRPSTTKGRYVESVAISATMTPSVEVDVA